MSKENNKYRQTIASYLEHRDDEPYSFVKGFIEENPGMEPIDCVIKALRLREEMRFLEIVEHFGLGNEIYEVPELRKAAEEVFEKSLVGGGVDFTTNYYPHVARELRELFSFDDERVDRTVKKAILSFLKMERDFFLKLDWVEQFYQNNFLSEKIIGDSEIQKALKICLTDIIAKKAMDIYERLPQMALEIFGLKKRFDFEKLKPEEVALIDEILGDEILSLEIKESLTGFIFDHSKHDVVEIRSLYLKEVEKKK